MPPIFVSADLVQAEWVVTAYCAQDARMKEVVEQHLDPHIRTGSLISGAPPGYVEYENTLVGHKTDPLEIELIRKDIPSTWEEDGQIYIVRDFFHPRSMSIRQGGKKSNHALNYDMGYRRFALENEMDEVEARRIVSLYKEVAYPGLQRYFKEVQRELRENSRRLKNCFGQSRQFLDRWDAELLNSAYAFKPQSTVANITNFGLRRIYNDTKHLSRVTPAAQVHDSVINEHEYSSIDELADQIRWVDRYMTTPCYYHGDEFELRREWKIGRRWGDDWMVSLEWGQDMIENALEVALADLDETEAELMQKWGEDGSGTAAARLP